MAPDVQAVVCAAQAWLQSSWHIHVPCAWLQACVEWLQQEAGGAAQLLQQQINQQVLDQWLLTDLRDLDHPVLPEGLAQAQKTELSGTFCVQVDSLLDISQPAYGQLLKWRGTDCSNDEVSAATLTTQRPWEARPTRMLLLQVTDGVQSLEAMEYQSIPSLSEDLRPGAKLRLQGKIVCRLGMLLLGPTNVTVLGGEVEDLVDRNNQGRMLCRILGVPEEQQQLNNEEAIAAPQQGDQVEEEDELEDAELLASLEAQEEADLPQVSSAVESGYGSLHQSLSLSSRRLPDRSFTSSSGISTSSDRSGMRPNSRADAFQGRRDTGEEVLNSIPGVMRRQQEVYHNIEEDFPDDEEFADIPLDELDNRILQESERMESSREMEISTTSYAQHRTAKPIVGAPTVSTSSREVNNTSSDFTGEEMDCDFAEVESHVGQARLHVDPGLGQDRESSTSGEAPISSSRVFSKSSDFMSHPLVPPVEKALEIPRSTPLDQCHIPIVEASSGLSSIQEPPDSNFRECTVTPTSPPFTYLCLIERLMREPPKRSIEIHVKAFIVTLLGKLSTNNGAWSICATISDGTAYLDVELSNEVVTELLGFSVAEKGALKHDVARRAEFSAGMRRCQEELVDMCCVMTIVVQPDGRKPVVTKAGAVSEKILQELERRMRDRMK